MPNPQTPPRRDEVEYSRVRLQRWRDGGWYGNEPAVLYRTDVDTLLTALSAAEGDVKRLDFLATNPIGLRAVDGNATMHAPLGDLLREYIDIAMADLATPGAGE